MDRLRLSLKEALQNGRISDFVVQEEARGVGATTKRDFGNAVSAVLKSQR